MDRQAIARSLVSLASELCAPSRRSERKAEAEGLLSRAFRIAASRGDTPESRQEVGILVGRAIELWPSVGKEFIRQPVPVKRSRASRCAVCNEPSGQNVYCGKRCRTRAWRERLLLGIWARADERHAAGELAYFELLDKAESGV